MGWEWWANFWSGIFGPSEQGDGLGGSGTRGQNDGYEEETGDGGDKGPSPNSDGG